MQTVDSLDIQIAASSNSANVQLDELIRKLGYINGSISGIGGSTGKLNKGMNLFSRSISKSAKSTKSLASIFGSFYANFYWLIRGAKLLSNSIKETANYFEAFNYFQVSYNKIASEWKQDYIKYGADIGATTAEEYAKSFEKRATESLSKLSGIQFEVGADGKGILTETGIKNLGLNIQEITQYASQLASVTNSIGQTGEVSLRASNAFTKLAGDISSLFNQDYSAVSKNLQSGLIGQSRALYKYGIDITNATLQTYAFNLGLEKKVSEMTQAEKMQLRMIAILEQSKVSWGDLANTINSPSNMLRQFTNNLKEAGMMLGQLFIPLLEKVLPFFNGLAIAIKRLLGDIAGFFGIKINADAFGKLPQDTEDLTENLEELEEASKKAKKGIRAFDELKTISTGANADNSSMQNTIDLTEEIIKATEEYERVWQEAYDKMEQRAEAFANKIEIALRPLKKVFEDISIGDWFAVGQDVSNIVTGIFDYFSNAIEKVDWEQVGKNIGLFLAGIDWSEILTSAFNLYRSLKDALIEVVRNSFEEAPMETFLIIAGIILRRLGGAIALKTLTISLSNVVISGIGKITLNSWINKHFSSQVAGLLPGTASNPFTLSSVVLSISSFLISPLGIGTPAFDVIANEIFGKLSSAIDLELPKWVEDFWNSLGTGLAVGALGGSWIPGVGTIAGAIVGGIIGALDGIKLENGTVLDAIMNDIFGADEVEEIFQSAKKAFEEKDWASFGMNILMGIGTGIQNFFYFLNYPITLLFETIWDLICNIFGINSPAKAMEPLGKNILLGVVEGFVGGFYAIKNAITDFFKKIKDWWKEKMVKLELKIKTPHLSITWDTKSSFANAAKLLGLKGIPKFDVQYYATGGYPTSGDLFFANENGVPELVGTMGGKTAVASGMEITGIKDAIYSTGQQETSLMATMVGLLRIIADKEFGITDSEIGKSAQRYARDYFNRTGNEAYSF